jgi:hypothetical protein
MPPVASLAVQYCIRQLIGMNSVILYWYCTVLYCTALYCAVLYSMTHMSLEYFFRSQTCWCRDPCSIPKNLFSPSTSLFPLTGTPARCSCPGPLLPQAECSDRAMSTPGRVARVHRAPDGCCQAQQRVLGAQVQEQEEAQGTATTGGGTRVQGWVLVWYLQWWKVFSCITDPAAWGTC